ncbi:MAG: hypothetical protein WA211_00980 [Candidatus Acidiferrales bacterium]
MNEQAWRNLEDRFTERRHEAFTLHRNGTRDETHTFIELVRIEAEYIQALYALYEKKGTESGRAAGTTA